MFGEESIVCKMYIALVLIFIPAYALIYYYIILPHKFWIKKGVKQGKPAFLFGDKANLKNEPVGFMVDRLYKRFPNERYSGIYLFLKPLLLIQDPNLIKQIAIKDFDYFTDHQQIFPNEQYWNKNLFLLQGEKWKEMRATLSPVFTSRKMKAMFILMSDCAERFTNYFINHPEECDVDLNDALSRYTNDAIATCAFGIEVNSMENKTNEFYMMGKRVTSQDNVSRATKSILSTALPGLFKLLGVKFFDPCIAKFFLNIMTETIKYREENNVVRPDLVQLLMETREEQLLYDENPHDEPETGFATVKESNYGKYTRKPKNLTIDDMTSQALVFFIAGFDSVSTVASFILHELAVNPDIQERLYREIEATSTECDGKITYTALNEMKYLDMVISETLRRWPPGPVADRICVRDYTIQPEREGEVPVHLKENDMIWLPIWSIHHDPKYYPNPYKFDPERFSDDNKANILLYTYMPFGIGPRNCIASRFALMEAKVLLYHLLLKFEIIVNHKTQIPIKLINRGFSIGTENGFHFTLKLRK